MVHAFGEKIASNDDPQLKAVDRILVGSKLLTKLDFLFSNPDYLALDLLQWVRLDDSVSAQKRRDIQVFVQQVFEDKEPQLPLDLYERYHYGPFFKFDPALEILATHGLLMTKSERSVRGKKTKTEYRLLKNGKKMVQKYLMPDEELAWYTQRLQILKKYYQGMNGESLTQRLYRHCNIPDLKHGIDMPNCSERVQELFQDTYQAALI